MLSLFILKPIANSHSWIKNLRKAIMLKINLLFFKMDLPMDSLNPFNESIDPFGEYSPES